MESEKSRRHCFYAPENHDHIVMVSSAKGEEFLRFQVKVDGKFVDVIDLEPKELEFLASTLKSVTAHMDDLIGASREVQRVKKEVGL